jgi:hypothetical protein
MYKLYFVDFVKLKSILVTAYNHSTTIKNVLSLHLATLSASAEYILLAVENAIEWMAGAVKKMGSGFVRQKKEAGRIRRWLGLKYFASLLTCHIQMRTENAK